MKYLTNTVSNCEYLYRIKANLLILVVLYKYYISHFNVIYKQGVSLIREIGSNTMLIRLVQ